MCLCAEKILKLEKMTNVFVNSGMLDLYYFLTVLLLFVNMLFFVSIYRKLEKMIEIFEELLK